MALPDGILKYFFDTCIWTLLAWFIDILLICVACRKEVASHFLLAKIGSADERVTWLP